LLPVHRFPDLQHQSLQDRSLYQLLRTHYGVVPVEAVETFTVGGISPRDARLLEVPAQTCAFFVERVTLDARGPFEWVTSIMRGDRYRIRLALRNP
jgi:GntR family transcriptional regulator